ncbi:peroxide stress protein YaaA [Marinilabilia salmonicolor]|uniref:peroxide stress protein YaaA n=1 Tax=Marinilabilia salmonicolor TaxID=989 RepID=UPI00029A3471|nr:peroxide stress protein YaaA [Marinilabilia salmonicolor]
MIAILSPAKKLDFEKKVPTQKNTEILFSDEASTLADDLKKLSPDELMKLMKISRQLGELNAERFIQWSWPFNAKEARQAIYAFNGEAYNGLDAWSLNSKEIDTAQKQLRILSGLYGVLRPLDNILPYRLEMGTKLSNEKGKDLYQFWGEKLTQQINKDLKEGKHKALVNLASQEYFKAIDENKIEEPIITPVFKENKNGTYKVISIYAKKARGMMVRFIVQNKLTEPEDLKAFNEDGYHYNNDLSKANQMVFTRH